MDVIYEITAHSPEVIRLLHDAGIKAPDVPEQAWDAAREALFDTWEQLADLEYSYATSARYQLALEQTPHGVRLRAEPDPFPVMLELGHPGYDMRRILSGPKGKVGPTGKRYVRFAMRWSAPGAKGASSTPMGHREAAAATDHLRGTGRRGAAFRQKEIEFGRPVHLAAKQLQASSRISYADGKTTYTKLSAKSDRLKGFGRYHGMMRDVGSTGQSVFTTIRTLSDSTPPDQFVVSARSGDHLGERAYQAALEVFEIEMLRAG